MPDENLRIEIEDNEGQHIERIYDGDVLIEEKYTETSSMFKIFTDIKYQNGKMVEESYEETWSDGMMCSGTYRYDENEMLEYNKSKVIYSNGKTEESFRLFEKGITDYEESNIVYPSGVTENTKKYYKNGENDLTTTTILNPDNNTRIEKEIRVNSGVKLETTSEFSGELLQTKEVKRYEGKTLESCNLYEYEYNDEGTRKAQICTTTKPDADKVVRRTDYVQKYILTDEEIDNWFINDIHPDFEDITDYTYTTFVSNGNIVEEKRREISGYQNNEYYYNTTYLPFIVTKPDGTIEEYLRDDDRKYINVIVTNPDGTQKIITYNYNEKGYIIGNNIKEVDKEGHLQTSTPINFNHIEYDEESYSIIMRKLKELSDEKAKEKVDKKFNVIESTMAVFNEKYNNKILLDVKEEIDTHIEDIEKLQKNINYSLLAYQTCDDELVDMANSLIDDLFDENENNVAKVFKNNISRYLEDEDSDGIYEYQKDVDYVHLYENVIPAYRNVDEKGNIWIYNKNKNLISAVGEELKINYGNEEFDVSFTNNGVIVLSDHNGNPLDIFGEYNIDSEQYGGNQMDFGNHQYELLQDENINAIFDKFAPVSTPEQRMAYLEKVCNGGCGKVAMTNVVFKMYEGHEEEFYEKFGYPMYNVKMQEDGNVGGVDYNYEPLVLELALTYDINSGGPIDVLDVSTLKVGTNSASSSMYKYLCSVYNLSDVDFNYEVNFYYDNGYNIYDLDGSLFVANGGSHAMIKIGETDDGKWIVSTWGRKLFCEPNNPSIEKYSSNPTTNDE